MVNISNWLLLVLTAQNGVNAVSNCRKVTKLSSSTSVSPTQSGVYDTTTATTTLSSSSASISSESSTTGDVSSTTTSSLETTVTTTVITTTGESITPSESTSVSITSSDSPATTTSEGTTTTTSKSTTTTSESTTTTISVSPTPSLSCGIRGYNGDDMEPTDDIDGDDFATCQAHCMGVKGAKSFIIGHNSCACYSVPADHAMRDSSFGWTYYDLGCSSPPSTTSTTSSTTPVTTSATTSSITPSTSSAVTTSPACPPGTFNYVANPGFEDSTQLLDGSSVVNGLPWTFKDNKISVRESSPPVVAHSGSHLVFVQLPDRDVSTSMYQQLSGLDTTQRYSIEYYYGFTTLQEIYDNYCYITILLDGTQVDEYPFKGDTAYQYSRYQATFTPPSANPQMEIQFLCGRGNYFYGAEMLFDDVSITTYCDTCTLSVPTPANTICGVTGYSPKSYQYPIGGQLFDVPTWGACADRCRTTQTCQSFTFYEGYGQRYCMLLTKPVSDLQVDPNGNPNQAFYDVGCFACQGGPTQVTTTATTTSSAEPEETT